MIFFLKHLKGIAYTLAILILFQSCVIYHKRSSPADEAISREKMPIKITTKDGDEYKFKWIEEEDGNIVSIKNVKRVYINKTDILQVELSNPAPYTVPLDQNLNLDGEIRIKSKKGKDYYKYRNFVKTKELNGIITGYKMTSRDTLTIVIPIDQIEKIQLKNVKVSRGVTIALVVTGSVGAVILGFIISFKVESRNSEGWW